MTAFDENELTAELYACDVARNLGVIAKAQHRISVALCSPHRDRVIAHLRELGIPEQAAASFAGNALSAADMAKVTGLLEKIEGWRPHLAEKVRALSISGRA